MGYDRRDWIPLGFDERAAVMSDYITRYINNVKESEPLIAEVLEMLLDRIQTLEQAIADAED